MSDSDDDQRRNQDSDLPPFRIRHNDMNIKLVKDIVRQLEPLFKKYTLEKDVCVKLVDYLKSQPQFKIGDGEWQCIIGSNLGCSLTYDLHVLTFFDYLPNGKSILVFKSG